jgi:uncharacterized protein (UPF0216 family)
MENSYQYIDPDFKYTNEKGLLYNLANIDDDIKVKDLKLPAGVEVLDDPEESIIPPSEKQEQVVQPSMSQEKIIENRYLYQPLLYKPTRQIRQYFQFLKVSLFQM